uniref:PDZ domain-containing protein n=1 Tax=Anopheles farauti TaxID=69004 RepID=A0A182QSV1_9DIPT
MSTLRQRGKYEVLEASVTVRRSSVASSVRAPSATGPKATPDKIVVHKLVRTLGRLLGTLKRGEWCKLDCGGGPATMGATGSKPKDPAVKKLKKQAHTIRRATSYDTLTACQRGYHTTVHATAQLSADCRTSTWAWVRRQQRMPCFDQPAATASSPNNDCPPELQQKSGSLPNIADYDALTAYWNEHAPYTTKHIQRIDGDAPGPGYLQLTLPRRRMDTAWDQGYGSERSPDEEPMQEPRFFGFIPGMATAQQQQPLPPSQEQQPEQQQQQQQQQQQAPNYMTTTAPNLLLANYSFITPDSIFYVQVPKGTGDLGLSVTGGTDSDEPFPGLIRIKRLFPHQAAWATGLLQPGDILLAANGVLLTGLPKHLALEVLRKASNVVLLTVCRPKDEQYRRKLSPPTEPPLPPQRKTLSNEPYFGGIAMQPSPRRAGLPFQQQQQQFHHTPTWQQSQTFLPSLEPTDDNFTGEFEIMMTKQQGSIGFTLLPTHEPTDGHYVHTLIREPALTDGRVRPGDKILAVNGVPISCMSHAQAVLFMRQAPDNVRLRLYRPEPTLQTPPSAQSLTDSCCYSVAPEDGDSCGGDGYGSGDVRGKVRLRPEAINLLTDVAAHRLLDQSVSGSSGASGGGFVSPRRLLLHRTGGHHHQQPNEAEIDPDDAFYRDDELDAIIANEACSSSSNTTATTTTTTTTTGTQSPKQSRPRPTFLALDGGASPPSEMLLVPCRTEQTLTRPDDEADAIYVQHFAHRTPRYSSMNVQHFTRKTPNYASVQGDAAEAMEAADREGKQSMQKWKGAQSLCAGEGEGDEAVGGGAGTQEPEEVQDQVNEQQKEPKLPDDVILPLNDAKPAAPEESTRTVDGLGRVQTITVTLRKGWFSRLGFTLKPLVLPNGTSRTAISAIYPGCVVDRDGRLRVGDIIDQVNNQPVEALTTTQLTDNFKYVRGTVPITVLRPVPAEDEKQEQQHQQHQQEPTERESPQI